MVVAAAEVAPAGKEDFADMVQAEVVAVVPAEQEAVDMVPVETKAEHIPEVIAGIAVVHKGLGLELRNCLVQADRFCCCLSSKHQTRLFRQPHQLYKLSDFERLCKNQY